jgi:hypothetical protein
MGRWIDRWVEIWMGRWVDGWKDGQTDIYYLTLAVHLVVIQKVLISA